MSDISISVEGLGKMYHIGGELRRSTTLRDAIAGAVQRPLERIRHPGAVSRHSDEL